MHGLGCTPSLLGWTRLLDEWIVGLGAHRRTAVDDAVIWDSEEGSLATFAEAATRVRSFVYRDQNVTPTELSADGTTDFVLQGCRYHVAMNFQRLSEPREFQACGEQWLGSALTRAPMILDDQALRVGVLMLVPCLEEGAWDPSMDKCRELLRLAQSLRTSAFAFSFPNRDELQELDHASERYPGAMLIARAVDSEGVILA